MIARIRQSIVLLVLAILTVLFGSRLPLTFPRVIADPRTGTLRRLTRWDYIRLHRAFVRRWRRGRRNLWLKQREAFV